MRSKGSSVLAALSSSSLYSSSSHSLCRVLSGSLSCTGIATLDRSLPMLFLRMFHRLTVLLLGLGEGRQDLRWQMILPSSTEPEFGFSISVPLLKLSMEMLSLMSLMYESSSDTWKTYQLKKMVWRQIFNNTCRTGPGRSLSPSCHLSGTSTALLRRQIVPEEQVDKLGQL